MTVHSSATHNRLKAERIRICPTTDDWIKKIPYNGILFGSKKKNE